jgi:hypothetical protein
MSIIADIRAFEILDSRGNPTVQAEVILENGIVGTLQHHQVHQRVLERPLSSEMVIKRGIWVRESSQL